MRVNYNKAVDTHTLFIEEVSAGAGSMRRSPDAWRNMIYLADAQEARKQILMIELKLADHPGSVTPVLEVLSRHRVNISYIGSQENGTAYQTSKWAY